MKVVLRLMRFVKKYWILLTVALICLLVSTVFSLIVPRMLGRGIDTVLKAGDQSFLYVAAGIIVGAAVLRGIAGYIQQYLSQVVSQKVSYDIRNALYDHLQKLSFAYHDKAQTGQLMSRATVDIEAVRMFLAMGLLSIFQIVLLTVGIAYVMIAANWSLALMTLAFFPFIAWITVILSSKLRPIWLRVQQLIAALGITLQESLIGIRVVKAFSRQKEESRKFSADADKLYEEQVNAARQTAINMPLMTFLLGLPTALVLWYGGRQVINGSMTVGNITEFILYIGMLGMPIRRLGMISNMYSRTASAGQRILEIFDTESLVKEKENAVELGAVKGQVEFKNVSFSYDSMGPALDEVSFRVEPGRRLP